MMVELPEGLRIELESWGFGEGGMQPDSEHRVTAEGAHLVYESEGEDYVLSSSTYFGEETSGFRPFLATVLDVLRWAAGDEVPHPIEERPTS